MMVNLMDNVESYTAYVGGPVWQTIYEENCVLDQAYKRYKDRTG